MVRGRESRERVSDKNGGERSELVQNREGKWSRAD